MWRLPWIAWMAASAASAATLAYVDASGHLVYQAEGARPKGIDAHGYEPSLRRDGKQLVYTRQTVSVSRT